MTELAKDEVRVHGGAHVRSRQPSETVSNEPIAWSRRPLSELSPAAAREGRLQPDDLRIHPQTLEQQASTAANSGNPQLAASLRLAAELTMLPDRELLALYDLLRPGGARLEALTEAEQVLHDLGLTLAAEHLRQAASWYETRGLIR